MMRMLWWLLLLVLGAWLAAWALTEQGYVAIEFAGYLVETSVSVLTLILLLLLGLVVGVVRVLFWLVNLPLRWRSWRQRRQVRAAGKRFEDGVMALAVGDAATASKKLAQARKLAPDQELVVRILQARWLLADDPLQAMTLIEALLASYPHQHALRGLYAEALAALGRWQDLETYLPTAKGVLPASRYEYLLTQVQAESVRTASDRQQLSERWQRLSSRAKTHPIVVEAYVSRALTWGRSAEFWPLLVGVMNSHWQARLLPLLAQVAGDDLYAELKQIQTWLKRHGEEPGLWWLSGVLASRLGLVGQAEDHLRKSLELAPSAAAALALSDLLAQEGRTDAACGVLRDLLGSPAALPQLAQSSGQGFLAANSFEPLPQVKQA